MRDFLDLPVPVPPSLSRHAAHRAADLSASDRFATSHRAADLSLADSRSRPVIAQPSVAVTVAGCQRASLACGTRLCPCPPPPLCRVSVSFHCHDVRHLPIPCSHLRYPPFLPLSRGTRLTRAPTVTPPCGCPTSQASCSAASSVSRRRSSALSLLRAILRAAARRRAAARSRRRSSALRRSAPVS